MAAGCVPVVIAKGGQPETVKHGENGFLWNTLEELQQFTRQVMKDFALRQRLSAKALQDSQKYDKVHFGVRLDELTKRIGI
jgi:glycosyltransferase involved in cell wall biosynthesis